MNVKQKLSILFYLKRKRATKDGMIPLYIRVTIDGLEDEISLSCKVRAEHWDNDLKQVLPDNSFLETQDYSYNIRGWLKGINEDYANNDNSHGGNSRWFGMELNYDWGFANNQGFPRLSLIVFIQEDIPRHYMLIHIA